MSFSRLNTVFKFLGLTAAFEFSIHTLVIQAFFVFLAGCYDSSSIKSSASTEEDYAENIFMEVDAAYAGLSITKQPSNVSVAAGQTVQIVVEAVTDRPPLRYQWKKLISGIYQNIGSQSYSNIFSISNAQVSNAGSYKVVVMNANNKKLTSSAAQINISSGSTSPSPASQVTLSISPSTLSFTKSSSGSISPSTMAMQINVAAGAAWNLGDSSPHINITPTSGVGPAIVYARPSSSAASATSGSNVSGYVRSNNQTVNYNIIFSVTAITPQPDPTPTDTTAPVISVNPTSVSINVGDAYDLTQAMNGVSASDNVDGNISSKIQVAGFPSSTASAGNFTITYNVKDAANNAAQQKIRTLAIVAPPPSPTPSNFSVNPTSLAFSKIYGQSNPASKSFQVIAPNGANCRTDDTIQFADSNQQPWISSTTAKTVTMTPSNGMNAAAIGTYNDKITVTCSGFSPIEVPVTLIVNPVQIICGDGVKASTEACDDGDLQSGDGCSANCSLEAGYICSGNQPTVCAPLTACNDGVDNDSDGAIDSSDFSCQQNASTSEVQYTSKCQNGIDDDNDGKIDLADDGCLNNQDNDEYIPPAGPRALIPGNGWTSATATPAARGTGLGAARVPIVDWDTVSNQTVNGRLNVGVLAWHINAAGIEKVSFSVENGPWVDITSVSENPDSCPTRTDAPFALLPTRLDSKAGDCIEEYWATFDATLFSSNKLVEVRAIVYPKVGQPIVLQGINYYAAGGMFLYANAQPSQANYRNQVRCVNVSNSACTGGSFSNIATAAQSIASAQGGVADGGTILLGAGTYSDVNTSVVTTLSTYLNIKAAPGVSRSQVTLTGSGGFLGTPTRFLHIDGVTMNAGIKQLSNVMRYGWISNSDLSAGDRLARNTWSTWQWMEEWYNPPFDQAHCTNRRCMANFFTDVHAWNAMDGILSATLVRNASVHTVTAQLLTKSKTMVNIDGYDHIQSGDVHGDVWHGYERNSDVLFYKVNIDVNHPEAMVTRGMNFFDSGGENVAIVDTNANSPEAVSIGSRLYSDGSRSPTSNAIFKDSHFSSALLGGSGPEGAQPIPDFVLENVIADQWNGPSRFSYPGGITIR